MRLRVARRVVRVVGIISAFALIAAVASPVGPAAAAKKKKPAAKPVETKLFLHGTLPIGEVDSEVQAPAYLQMSPEEPAGTEPRSYGVTNYAGGPNDQCAGNTLFPVWVGRTAGKVVGDLKLTFHAVSTGGQVDVRVWPDVNSQLCDSGTTGAMEYVDPATSVTLDLPQGHATVEAVLPNTSFDAQALLMVQITPVVSVPPFVSRVLYDTAEFGSVLEFSCIPTGGQSTCATN